MSFFIKDKHKPAITLITYRLCVSHVIDIVIQIMSNKTGIVDNGNEIAEWVELYCKITIYC